MKKKFNNISPCELTISNMDRSCALDGCRACGYLADNDDIKWFNKVKIVAICNAPFVGGIKEDRPLAIVYECPKCFEKFWFHTTKSHKQTLEYLLKEGVIKLWGEKIIMEYFEPYILKNGNYRFEEIITRGYLANSNYAHYTIITEWNKNEELIYCAVDTDNYTSYFDCFGNIIKADESFHFNRMKRGVKRHQKYLRIFLGKDKLPEKEQIPILYKPFGFCLKIRIKKAEFSKAGNPKIEGYRNVRWVKLSKEKAELADKYNKLIDDFRENEQELRKRIFGE